MIQSETQSVSTFLFMKNFYLDNAIFDIQHLIWKKWCKFENCYSLAEGVTSDFGLIRLNEGIIDANVPEVIIEFFA